MTDFESLRRQHYNATVVSLRRQHEDLLVLRLLPDAGPIRFVPGQYTTLGLGDWEPCVDGAPHARDAAHQVPPLIRRAYSFSAAMIDDAGAVLPPNADSANEFYIALVHREPDHPMLTPRLFALAEGARLFVGLRPHGQYTAEFVTPDDTLVFVATGTGEAPHNAMIAHLLAAGHRGPIVAVTCVRYRRDLAYLAAHERLQAAFANYRYIWLTTREAENVDPATPGYVGKRYVQDYFADGGFTRDTGVGLRPDATHVFLCGNPQMIGDIHVPKSPAAATPATSPSTGPPGMIQILERLGFTLDHPHARGTIHVERYW